MIQKGTILIPLDKCGIWGVNVFNLYGGFSRKITCSGAFVKVSCRLVSSKNWMDKKTKLKALVIYTKFRIRKSDGTNFSFKLNSCTLLTKRLTTKGREIVGPGIFELKRKRFLSSFVSII